MKLGACIIKNRFYFSSQKHHTLVFMRHGQSTWNKQKKWAGWTDVALSPDGANQAAQCAKLIMDRKLTFDVVYTSMLSRANKTAEIILREMNLQQIPVYRQWRLNEKHYGILQGCSKIQINKKYGTEKVNEWRRSFNVRPPPLEKSDPTNPANIEMYKNIDPAILPNGESQEDVINRLKPLWENQISVDIREGKKVMIVAHGSSFRSLMYILNPNISQQQIQNENIPNATPAVLTLDHTLKLLKKQFLGDPQLIQKRMKKVKHEHEGHAKIK